jgi:hypothetical protein
VSLAPFCPGRTDATDGKGSEYLTPRTDYAADPALATATTKDQMAVMGLSLAEGA